MSNYTESKNKLDAIRQKYGCKGDVLFRSAIQYVVEYGQCNFNNQAWYDSCIKNVDKRHDRAEQEGKILFVTRDFEKALLECTKELAQIGGYDLLIYIQQEVWLGGSEAGKPDYQRALEIIRNCLYCTDNAGGYYTSSPSITLGKFREMELTDDEIAYFGWEYLLDAEDEEDE